MVAFIQPAARCNWAYGSLLEVVVFLGSCSSSHEAAEQYYRYINSQNYDSAFKYVAYHVDFSTSSPSISFDVAKHIWIERVTQLRESGNYVIAVKWIDVYIDDGYPVGRATIRVMEQGVQKDITQRVHFVNQNGWKVQSVVSEGGPTALDEAISGRLPMP
jgi:hypothetical protein